MRLDRLRHDGELLLVRTDFSDERTWEHVSESVKEPADFGIGIDPDVPGDDGLYTPNIATVADRELEGATGQSIVEAAAGELLGYLLLADARSMREAVAGGELTVAFVDLSVETEDAEEFGWVYGREFRCAVGEVASIEANLSIANMGFDEFADSVEDDGVFRGFPQ